MVPVETHPGAVSETIDTDPEASLLSHELRTHLLDAVERLASAQRVVITLRDLVGLDADDVCSLLEISDGNQRVLLHRTRARVLTELAPLVEAED